MFLAIRKFNEKVSNPYYTSNNSSIEPEYVEVEHTHVTVCLTEDVLANYLHTKDKTSSYTFYRAEPIFPRIETVSSLVY